MYFHILIGFLLLIILPQGVGAERIGFYRKRFLLMRVVVVVIIRVFMGMIGVRRVIVGVVGAFLMRVIPAFVRVGFLVLGVIAGVGIGAGSQIKKGKREDKDETFHFPEILV